MRISGQVPRGWIGNAVGMAVDYTGTSCWRLKILWAINEIATVSSFVVIVDLFSLNCFDHRVPVANRFTATLNHLLCKCNQSWSVSLDVWHQKLFHLLRLLPGRELGVDGHQSNQSVSPMLKVSITINACQSTANIFDPTELDEVLRLILNHVRVLLEGIVGEVRGNKKKKRGFEEKVEVLPNFGN